MQARDFKEFFAYRPRRPFRLKLTNGKKIDIKHPEFAVLFLDSIEINIPERNSTIIKDYSHVPLTDVVGAEFIASRTKGKRKAHTN